MNAKKNKNKNRQNKPPNLVPPQQEIINPKVDEISSISPAPAIQEKQETVLKTEERVPEILSEVTTVSKDEGKAESHTDSPKKPKRNRGKKKKSDKEESEIEEVLAQVCSAEDDKNVLITIEKIKPAKSDTFSEVANELANPSTVVVSRKKKNKNKQELFDSEIVKTEDTKVQATVDVNLVELSKNLETCVLVEPETESPTEQTKAKKNNKKNKKTRSDSEKSNKGEQIDSCTSLFENIQINKELDVCERNPDEVTATLAQLTFEKVDSYSEAEAKCVKPLKVDKPNDVDLENQFQEIKTKKKNKKDRKVSEKDDQKKESMSDVKESAFSDSSVSEPTVKEVDKSEDIMRAENLTKTEEFSADGNRTENQPNLSQESKNKKKGKKDKKLLDKNDHKIEDTLKISECVTSSKSSLQITEQIPDTSHQYEPTKSEVTHQEIREDSADDQGFQVQEPKHKKKNKKDKKLPVPELNKDNTTKLDELKILSDDNKVNVKIEDNFQKHISFSEENKEDSNQVLPKLIMDEQGREFKNYSDLQEQKDVENTKNESKTETIKPLDKKTKDKSELSEFQKLLDTKDFTVDTTLKTVTEATENVDNKITVASLISTDMDSNVLLGPKIDNKRKKSPKPSKKHKKIATGEVIEPDQSIIAEEIEKDETSKTKECLTYQGQKSDEACQISTTKVTDKILYNDGVEKPKLVQEKFTESTPDPMKYLQTSSSNEKILDDNNNFVKQELEKTQVLSVPIVIPDAPLVQTSSSLTIVPSNVIASGIHLLEKKSEELPKKGSEKTDLKSKVMEVNKDMEDLRLSIERSLAELTALDKSEKDNNTQSKKSLDQIIPLPETSIKHEEPMSDFKEQISIASFLPEKNIALSTKTKNSEKIKSEAPKKNEIIKSDIQTKQFESFTAKDALTILPELDRQVTESPSSIIQINETEPPICPVRKDHKGKSKSKKKNKQESSPQTSVTATESSTTTTSNVVQKETIKAEKEEQSEKQDKTQSSDDTEKTKQQAASLKEDEGDKSIPINYEQSTILIENKDAVFEPIENFEDALTSSADDVNQTFEMIAKDIAHGTENKSPDLSNNPQINISEPDEPNQSTEQKPKEKPIVSQPKNLLGHPNIPVQSNKTDYKKEKNRTPNTQTARVKIKDADEIDKTNKLSKECQTENKPKISKNLVKNHIIKSVNDNEEYIYKYSFRKVFLSSACHVCKSELKRERVTCKFCHLTFYCSQKHKDEDWPQHQALCFAVSTIVHLKGQKHLYADSQHITGQEYRLLRMQAIVACEKILKRKLQPWEQEVLLYPRVCAEPGCREWRAHCLRDCEGCGQISYCSSNPEHFPKCHVRWCKSYSLYQKLVVYQQTFGRLEPALPTRGIRGQRLSDNINRLLADMYEEKIEMNDLQYAALTQLASAPLSAAYSYQLFSTKMDEVYPNGSTKRSTLAVHVVGAELQFEADSLHKWELFFLHLKPEVRQLTVVLVGQDLNPANLPLDLLANVKLCNDCRQKERQLTFKFQDKQHYYDYWGSNDFITPDIVCAFNPAIHRSTTFSLTDIWTSTVNCIFKLKSPLLLTSYTMSELQRDLTTIRKISKVDFNTISEPKFNPFASVRPDRNFITDDEIPLLFKNYCYMLLIGAF